MSIKCKLKLDWGFWRENLYMSLTSHSKQMILLAVYNNFRVCDWSIYCCARENTEYAYPPYLIVV